MTRLRLIVAGAVLLASVAACSSASVPAPSATDSSAATEMSIHSSSASVSSPDDLLDATYLKTLHAWAPALNAADLAGAVTDGRGVCDQMKSNQTAEDDKRYVQGNAMGMPSSYGVDQATANKIVIFSAHTYCPEYESTVAGFFNQTVFPPTS